MKSFLIFSSFLTLSLSVFGQTGSIKGRVVDTSNDPVIGATVKLKGLLIGASTDVNGRYLIEDVPTGQQVIEITSIGFALIERAVKVNPGKTATANITMEVSATELSSVVVEGKSIGRELSEQPIQVTSIELNEFQFESADVIDVLDRSAGVRVRQSGGLGSDANIQLNGFTGRAVRIYYDGIPLELLGGGIQVNNLPVNNIARVDVYKGVMPVDVGTDALAGGINIVPKLVETDYFDASYQIGSFNTHIASLNATKTLADNLFVNFSGFYNYSDNNYENDVRNLVILTNEFGGIEDQFEENIRVRRFHDRHQSSMTNVQIGTSDKRWTDQLIYSISYNQRSDEIQHGVRIGNKPVGEAERVRSAFIQSLKYKKDLIPSRLRLDYFGNYAWMNNTVEDSTTNLYNWFGEINPDIGLGPGNEIAGVPTRREGNDRSSTQRLTFNYELGTNHTLTFSNFYAWQKVVGEDPLARRITEDEIDPNTIPSYLNRFISGLSYRGKWFNEKLESIVFGKFYYFDNQAIQITQRTGQVIFDSRVSGNDYGYGLGLKYSFKDDFFIRASYEQALRIPDASEVFGDFITIASNPTLRPEQSNNINFGGYFKHRFDSYRSVSLEVSYFIRDQTDLIRLEPGRNETEPGQFINEAEVDGNGIEITLAFEPLKGLQIDANYTSQDIVIAGEVNDTGTNLIGSPVPNIPLDFYNISARYTRETPWRSDHNFTVFGYYNYVDDFDLIPQGTPRNPDNIIPTQESIDAGLTYALDRGHSLSLQVNNITNNAIFDNFSVPRPGINYSIKYRYLLQK
ncbi:MAG: TonB-dependent receptor [Bacteroidota bacterium]